jgi:myosin-1
MIISRINKNIDPLHMSRSDEVLLSVGVLDIYGFEIFDKNGFEQICINYVNEKLQQIFVDLVLRAEQEEYTREGIVWAPIPYFNNSVVCELLDGSIPAGLFRMMDDVCNMMHSSENSLDMDKKLLQNASEVHGYHPHFFKTNNGFTIRHYAGDVEYRIGQICETNRDSLKIDLLYLLQTAGETMVSQELYGDDNGNDFKSMITAGSRIRTQCQVNE